jgi:hypothetical protein
MRKRPTRSRVVLVLVRLQKTPAGAKKDAKSLKTGKRSLTQMATYPGIALPCRDWSMASRDWVGQLFIASRTRASINRGPRIQIQKRICFFLLGNFIREFLPGLKLHHSTFSRCFQLQLKVRQTRF